MTIIKDFNNWFKSLNITYDDWDMVKHKHNFHKKDCSCAYCAGFRQMKELVKYKFKEFAVKNLDEIKYNILGLSKERLEIRKNKELLKFVKDLEKVSV